MRKITLNHFDDLLLHSTVLLGHHPPSPPIRVSQYTNVTMVILEPHTGPSIPAPPPVRVSQYTNVTMVILGCYYVPTLGHPPSFCQSINVTKVILGCYYIPHTGPSPPVRVSQYANVIMVIDHAMVLPHHVTDPVVLSRKQIFVQRVTITYFFIPARVVGGHIL